MTSVSFDKARRQHLHLNDLSNRDMIHLLATP